MLAYMAYWLKYNDGKQTILDSFERRQRNREVLEALPDDMEALKKQNTEYKRMISLLMEHTGMGAPDEEIDVYEKEASDDETKLLDAENFEASVERDHVDYSCGFQDVSV
ncbi:expressed unknown protein [Seminavis robusta]|uniref:Uncharacterized protein n=1 Tax=Seminavis robusta TaxID=568900 RepID=A0A9N8HQ06_9STRA|nr:expressed unknown protein [Seminavis robusta]|eukprot:Sro943_g222810.1 n/a (110) ;mRNA; f:27755-28084